MDIILKEDIDNLGHEGEVVNVKDGYARNFLIPKGKAIIASESAKKVHQENLRQRAYKEERMKEEATKLAEEIKRKKLKIGAKTSSTGKIFGSVNTIQLAEAFSKKGIDVDRKMLSIKEESVKEVGTYHVVIKLHRDVEIEMPFEVVSE